MADHDYQPVDRNELDRLAGEALPERAAMSLVNANVAAPINLAAALNVASDNATAVADASQTAPIDQSNGGGTGGPIMTPPIDQAPPATS